MGQTVCIYMCVCVCVCVCKRGEGLGVDYKVRGASLRCGLEAGDGAAVLGGDDGTSFQYHQAKKNNTLIIPLSDWIIIYFASIQQIHFFNLCSKKQLLPYPTAATPLCVCLVHVHSLFH
jgi:hypothetical protein